MQVARADQPRQPRAQERSERADQEAELERPLGGNSTAPSVVVLVSRVTMTAEAKVVPIERISPLSPTADAASRIGTESRIRVGIAA